MALIMIYENNGGNGKSVYSVKLCCLLSQIKLCFIDYISCQ